MNDSDLPSDSSTPESETKKLYTIQYRLGVIAQTPHIKCCPGMRVSQTFFN